MQLSYKRANGRYIYPFGQMAYGDRIVVPNRLAKKATSAAYMYGSRHGLYFRCKAYGRKRVRIELRRSP